MGTAKGGPSGQRPGPCGGPPDALEIIEDNKTPAPRGDSPGADWEPSRARSGKALSHSVPVLSSRKPVPTRLASRGSVQGLAQAQFVQHVLHVTVVHRCLRERPARCLPPTAPPWPEASYIPSQEVEEGKEAEVGLGYRVVGGPCFPGGGAGGAFPI